MPSRALPGAMMAVGLCPARMTTRYDYGTCQLIVACMFSLATRVRHGPLSSILRVDLSQAQMMRRCGFGALKLAAVCACSGGHIKEIECIAWSDDGRFIASGSRDGTIRIWEASTARCLNVLN